MVVSMTIAIIMLVMTHDDGSGINSHGDSEINNHDDDHNVDP